MLGTDFGAYPPEINSARIYAGPGSSPLIEAAAAWDRLATELNSTAASYASVIVGLTGQEWSGPSAISMAATAAPYVAWMRTTAAQAEQAAGQALAAAHAYESAYAATVPPTTVATNRSSTLSLVRSNIFGQNTPAIATSEADYDGMWVQDTVAMESYAGNSAAALELTPFTPPPPIASESGLLTEATSPSAAAMTGLAASIPTPIPGLEIPIPPFLEDLDVLVLTSLLVAGGGLAVALGQFAEEVHAEETEEEELAQEHKIGEELETSVVMPGDTGGEAAGLRSAPGSGAAVAASTGRAATLGGLSVPQSWILPPAVRQVAAMFPGATPMVLTSGADGGYAGVAAAGLAATSLAGLAARGSAPNPPAAASTASGGSGAAAIRTATNTPAVPAAVTAAQIPGLPPGLPPGVVANLAATLAAIPGATIIVVPPNPNQ